MKFKGIEKKQEGKFITRYDLFYETADGMDKTYEMISRNPKLETREELTTHKPDAVVIIMHDETGERVLLNKEFRMACGDFVFNFPAGLIDAGEDLGTAQGASLRKKRGLTLYGLMMFCRKASAPSDFPMRKMSAWWEWQPVNLRPVPPR